MSLLIVTAILTSLKPLISYIFIGQLDTVLPVYFPGINEQEIIGYTVLALFHVFLLFIFAVGTAGCDLGLMTFVVHCYAMSHLYQNSVNDLNGLIKRNKQNASDKDKDIRASLDNLIMMHNDFIKCLKLNVSIIICHLGYIFSRYTGTLKTIYSDMCLVQISMANTIMIVLLYVILLVTRVNLKC